MAGVVLKVLRVSHMITLLMGMAAVLALAQILAPLLLLPFVGILVTILHAMAVTPQSQSVATDDLEYLARSKSKRRLNSFGCFSIPRLALPTNSGLPPNGLVGLDSLSSFFNIYWSSCRVPSRPI